MAEPRAWLLLITQVPAKPDYLRVKVGRRLQRVGAVAVKAGVYALPAIDESREDLSWIAREVEDGGGDAQIVEARLVEGLSDEVLVARFDAARDQEAGVLLTALGALADGAEPELKRLRTRIDELIAIDFFGAARVREVREQLRRRDEAGAPRRARGNTPRVLGRTWITRAGIKVDRMASAWLVRRFVDPQASFRFVAARSVAPGPGELRFDMIDAEYGHEGDACTFEVFIRRFDLDAPGLGPLAELVHDVDCKDGKFARPETEGFALTVEAIAAAHPTDEARLERASAWLDDLLVYFERRT